MRKSAAAFGSLVFFVIAPGIVAGVLPWYLTEGWSPNDSRDGAMLTITGVTLVVAGSLALIGTFALYVWEGSGTPAPVAPTEELVVRGLNRYVRNPMYLAVVTVIVGQALILDQPGLLVYAAVAWATMAAFAHWYEEPHLRGQFGQQYEAYCESVPAWIPHRTRRR